jgi:hypothetical protein
VALLCGESETDAITLSENRIVSGDNSKTPWTS